MFLQEEAQLSQAPPSGGTDAANGRPELIGWPTGPGCPILGGQDGQERCNGKLLRTDPRGPEGRFLRATRPKEILLFGQ
jgi:hypothetical protein